MSGKTSVDSSTPTDSQVPAGKPQVISTLSGHTFTVESQYPPKDTNPKLKNHPLSEYSTSSDTENEQQPSSSENNNKIQSSQSHSQNLDQSNRTDQSNHTNQNIQTQSDKDKNLNKQDIEELDSSSSNENSSEVSQEEQSKAIQNSEEVEKSTETKEVQDAPKTDGAKETSVNPSGTVLSMSNIETFAKQGGKGDEINEILATKIQEKTGAKIIKSGFFKTGKPVAFQYENVTMGIIGNQVVAKGKSNVRVIVQEFLKKLEKNRETIISTTGNAEDISVDVEKGTLTFNGETYYFPIPQPDTVECSINDDNSVSIKKDDTNEHTKKTFEKLRNMDSSLAKGDLTSSDKFSPDLLKTLRNVRKNKNEDDEVSEDTRNELEESLKKIDKKKKNESDSRRIKADVDLFVSLYVTASKENNKKENNKKLSDEELIKEVAKEYSIWTGQKIPEAKEESDDNIMSELEQSAQKIQNDMQTYENRQNFANDMKKLSRENLSRNQSEDAEGAPAANLENKLRNYNEPLDMPLLKSIYNQVTNQVNGYGQEQDQGQENKNLGDKKQRANLIAKTTVEKYEQLRERGILGGIFKKNVDLDSLRNSLARIAEAQEPQMRLDVDDNSQIENINQDEDFNSEVNQDENSSGNSIIENPNM